MMRRFLLLLICVVSFGIIACSKGTDSKEIKVAVSPASADTARHGQHAQRPAAALTFAAASMVPGESLARPVERR